MGEYITRLFPDPLEFPGGESWKLSCRENFTASHWPTDSSCSWEDTEADIYGMLQVLFMGLVYAFILFYASNEISEGSEKLLLIPSWRGLVGTVVLPILGAVPDGAIVLFSGLGDDAQTQISVGVGALAGSTIMLLTIPWFLSIYAGRVRMEGGVAQYHSPKNRPKAEETWSQLLFQSGVQVKAACSKNADIMLITAVSYLLCQSVLFATGSHGQKDEDDDNIGSLRSNEKWLAFATALMCIGFFAAYLYLMMNHTEPLGANQKIVQAIEKAFKSGDVNILALFTHILHPNGQCVGVNMLKGVDKAALKAACRGSFNKYDTNGDHSLDQNELKNFLRDIGMTALHQQVAERQGAMKKILAMKSVQLQDFVDWVPLLVKHMRQKDFQDALAEERGARARQAKTDRVQAIKRRRTEAKRPSDSQGDTKLDEQLLSDLEAAQNAANDDEDNEEEIDDDEEEEEEETEKYTQTNPDGTRTVREDLVKRDAFKQMAIGTLLVLLFSDPMCTVFTSIGNRIGIDAFFISFVLAPLASNASELIAAYSFASKKTKHSVTVALTQLEGAAIMNNTFCLGIFMVLIYVKGLVWVFSAETISILVVQIAIYLIAKMWRNQSVAVGLLVLSLYPLSIALVILLEGIGLD